MVAKQWLEWQEATRDADNSENHWTFDCVESLRRHDPTAAFDLVLIMISNLQTPWQAVMIAAGPLEDLIADAPDVILPNVEEPARKCPRFRWVLTGVWPLGNRGTPEWERVLRARAGSLTIDESSEIPKF